MTIPLRVGMGSRYGLDLLVLASVDFDPLLPDGAIIEMTKPDGTVLEWTGVMGAQSSASARVTYAFNEDGSDLDEDGTWRVWIQWTEGSDLGARSEVGSFAVVAADHL